MRKAKIGLMQVCSDNTWDTPMCINHLMGLAETCLEHGADLVFMPEFYQYKHVADRETLNALAGAHRDGFLNRCQRLAKKFRAYVAAWDVEPGQGGYYNSCYIFGRDGNEVGRYRKVCITDTEEAKGILPGCDLPVFELDFGKIGIMICMDNYYPECASVLARRGAELILYPLYGDTFSSWETRTRARAIDNVVYVAPCPIQGYRCRPGTAWTGMIDPEGTVVCVVKDDGSTAVAEIDLGQTVVSHLSGGRDRSENLAEYLARSRNSAAFAPLCEPAQAKPWSEIITYRA